MKKEIRMRGALPVPYIVAIIIAILVIAVLVYWFFVLSGQGNTISSEFICKGKEIAYCTQWSAAGYDPSRQPSGKAFSDWAPDCASYSWARTVAPKDCRDALLQQTATATT